MAMESPLRILGSSGAAWPVSKDTAAYSSSTSNVAAEELGLLLNRHGYHGKKNITGPGRSGSAPPSMEGSRVAFDILKGQQTSSSETSMENLINAAKSCKSEEQLRAHPAYLAYYFSNVNLNPRLPPPLISRENRQLMHHIGGFGDNWRMPSLDDSSKASFDSSRTLLSTHKEEPEDDKSPRLETSNWTDRNTDLSGKFTSPLPGRLKSLVDLIQEDFPRTPSPVYNNQSHPSSKPTEERADDLDSCINPVHEPESSVVGGRPRTPIVSGHLVGTMRNGDVVIGQLSPSTSADRTVNLNRGLKGDSSIDDAKLGSGVLNSAASGSNLGITKIEMNNLKISGEGHRNQQTRQNFQQFGLPPRGSSSQPHSGPSLVIPQGTHIYPNATDNLSHGQSKISSAEVQPVLQSAGITPSLYATAAGYGTSYYPNLQPSNLYPPHFGIGGYALSSTLMPPLITGYPPQSALPLPFDNPVNPNFGTRASGVSGGGNFVPGVDLQQFYKMYGQLGLAIQPSLSDPLYMPYFQHPSLDAFTGVSQHGSMLPRGGTTGSPAGSYDPQKRPSSAAYSPDQRPHLPRTGSFNSPTSRKGGNVSPNYYGNTPNMGVVMQYPNSLLASPVFQGSGTNFSGRRNDIRFPFNSARTAGTYSGWQRQRGREKVDDPKSHSFLEGLKASKARSYDLSDTAGHIVEFSCDQHGSRFIQQKLETCSIEEKASVFREVLPHASTLMTDVFGNYVIQKFFEHGSPEQRKELANKLIGRMLPLSLQMYGCRVIQKALEVIELDQKIQLVQELDGHVMQCVRDQNGNHVIQKCIECVPAEKIGFIISAFRGEVATLSKHPYGCRVIQRVLEHCTDESYSQWIVDEILQSACHLAQDQYGNYVTQHVLEKGKAHERSYIISKLAGQVLQMSQHKFASNVIEKCLEHGNTAERELLIEEIVGQTEGNDNLLVMMKDQFANYVVQKILETCSDKQREVLVSRIKVHLQALRKYTYGKHIVGRVEQLCGEEIHASAES